MTPETMPAVGFRRSLPIEDADALEDIVLPTPQPGPNDLLVQVAAVSVNPADAKIRIRSAPDAPLTAPKVLGYDAVGQIVGMGAQITGFSVGQRVWYAGDATRPGSYAAYQCVDHRIAAPAPESMGPSDAAALPLTGLTAWELLFDRLGVPMGAEAGTLLIIGGAGGVGSVTTQLARLLTGLTITATASRPESANWCRSMGAHFTADHRDLVQSYRSNGHEHADYIVQYADTAAHWDAMCELVAPQGRIGTIVETEKSVDISALQGKSAALMWELMFTRPMFATADMARQGQILRRLAGMADSGQLRSTGNERLHGLTAETFKTAHSMIETGSMIGKLVVKY